MAGKGPKDGGRTGTVPPAFPCIAACLDGNPCRRRPSRGRQTCEYHHDAPVHPKRTAQLLAAEGIATRSYLQLRPEDVEDFDATATLRQIAAAHARMLDRLADLVARHGDVAEDEDGTVRSSKLLREWQGAAKDSANIVATVSRLAIDDTSAAAELLASQAWAAVAGAVVQALAPFPEARAALAGVLALDGGGRVNDSTDGPSGVQVVRGGAPC